MPHPDTEVVIIGAGPSGLAAAACLRREGVAFEILERNQVPGSAWHNHYERLHLHTIKTHSSLPHLPFPAHYPPYPSRNQIAAYLADYAAHFGIEPRYGETVERAERAGDLWRTETASGLTLHSRRLVVATGYNGVPRVPTWPGQEDFAGEILHSSDYRTGMTWQGKRAMVVGVGNSGAEIAVDLWESGARDVLLCARSPVWVTPRDYMGMSAQTTGIALSKLPLAISDRIGSSFSKLVYGDLSKYGLRRPEIGPFTQITKLGRVPLIDIGTIELIRQGQITVVGDIARFTEDSVVFKDGSTRPLEVAVLATGFKARLERFLPAATEHAGLIDDRGYPTVHGAESQLPGLYFIGFRNPPTGQLRDINHEAQRVAAHIRRVA